MSNRISRGDLAKSLLQAFPSLSLDHIEFYGGEYHCPTVEWLREFGAWLAPRRPDYMADAFVCEQFARWAASKADEAWLKACREDETLPRIHHAFGEARGLLMPDNAEPGLGAIGSPHALNICFCTDSQWYVFEPQSSEDYASILPAADPRNLFRPTRVRV